MKAVELAAPSFVALHHVTLPDPGPPGPGRIVVRMKAASFNFADLAVITGKFPGVSFPIIPIADGAGEVVSVGEGVWQVKPGDRVAAPPKPDWVAGPSTAKLAGAMRGVTLPGALVEFAELSAASVVKAPDHLNWEEIASLPIAAMTAWRALEMAAIGPASIVVVLGTGGVSIFTLQLAKALGARVIVTSSSNEKLERARNLGADITINYRATPDWHEVILAETENIGADFILDPVGGVDFYKTIAAVRHGGTVSAIGFLGGTETPLNLLHVVNGEVRIQGSNGGSVADFAAAVAVISRRQIRPVVDRVFPLSDLVGGYKLMAAAEHFGKIAIRLDW